MPANLPPQYFAAEQRWREAATVEEQIQALREMLSIMPKHKGTDKLQADLKRRIAKLQAEARAQGKRGRRSQLGYVPKEGAGQVAIIGPPNAGKSALVKAITHATPQVASYPYTTQRPMAAMMPYEDIQIQMVDTPPISQQYMAPWLPNLIRLADLALLVVGLDLNPAGQAQLIIDLMAKTSTHLAGSDQERDGQMAIVQVKTMIVGNKDDLPQARENLPQLRDRFGGEFQILTASAKSQEGLQELGEKIFQALDIIRIYTKEPGKKPDLHQPYVLKRGSTVLDLATTIHRDFGSQMRYARIWGSERYDGQNVQKNHPLEDGDILEFHV